MIDIENIVIDKVATRLSDTCRVLSDSILVSNEYPFVTIYESNNVIHKSSYDRQVNSNELVTYEINVYSNLQEGKKEQAKSIVNEIDDVMSGLGFIRLYCQPTPNIDITIYRVTMRYEGIVSKVATDKATIYKN